MNLNTGWTELNNSLKTLHECWDAARDYWKDAVAEEFDNNYLHPLDLQVRGALRGIERLMPALQQLRQECG
jgi:hypothetical protein